MAGYEDFNCNIWDSMKGERAGINIKSFHDAECIRKGTLNPKKTILSRILDNSILIVFRKQILKLLEYKDETIHMSSLDQIL